MWNIPPLLSKSTSNLTIPRIGKRPQRPFREPPTGLRTFILANSCRDCSAMLPNCESWFQPQISWGISNSRSNGWRCHGYSESHDSFQTFSIWEWVSSFHHIRSPVNVEEEDLHDTTNWSSLLTNESGVFPFPHFHPPVSRFQTPFQLLPNRSVRGQLNRRPSILIPATGRFMPC